MWHLLREGIERVWGREAQERHRERDREIERGSEERGEDRERPRAASLGMKREMGWAELASYRDLCTSMSGPYIEGCQVPNRQGQGVPGYSHLRPPQMLFEGIFNTHNGRAILELYYANKKQEKHQTLKN